MKIEVINHLTWLTNSLSETYMYNWEAVYKEQRIKEVYDRFYESIGDYIDVTNLTLEEAKELRFTRWSNDSDIWLFPLWVVSLIPDGTTVYSINEEPFVYKKGETDNGIRLGCVSYGLKFSQSNLETVRNKYGNLTNDLTRELDSYLKPLYKKNFRYSRNHLYREPKVKRNGDKVYAIRYPGATRGNLVVNEHDEIVSVTIFKDDYKTDEIYTDKVSECLDKYIGMVMVIREEE